MALTPDYLYLERNLSQEDINKIYELIELGEEVNGMNSVISEDPSFFAQIKSNTQIILPYEEARVLNDIIYGTLDSHREFHDFTIPIQSACPTLSRMNVGDFYKPHQDFYKNGDFSTTLFLSDPDTYEGGELCLWINDEERMFKPPQGSSVTYRTGTPHRVNTVTKGTRDVAIFWTQSLLKDPFHIEIYHGLVQIAKSIPPKVNDTLDEALSDPGFIAETLIRNLYRYNYRK